MRRIAIYGKGGSGKSTLAANLSLLFARKGMRVLQIGCDPKHDSTRALLGHRRASTIIDLIGEREGEGRVKPQDYLYVGTHGVGCVEAGGPAAGVGCAGLGITAAFRVIERDRVIADYDVVIMDVLGDVVCGGFATPLIRGLADYVVIVVSEARMSLYAANNIARAVVRYRRAGAVLAGLVVNNAGHPERLWEVQTFASRIGTRVLGVIPRSPAFAEAERLLQPVTALDPSCPPSLELARLCDLLGSCEADAAPLSPLDDDELDEFFRGLAGG